VAYLGDDRTDEDAFKALAGRGLAVLVREELRPTAAAVWLRPPVELLDFLQRWMTACPPRTATVARKGGW
jgi:trehalose-6-phosphatase